MPPETAFHLYVHWPFCRTKCGYCDFASVVPKRHWDVDAWREAYLRDIANLKIFTGQRELGSIFFGGGTPSLAEPELIGAVIDAAMATWEPRSDCEVSMEVNPGTVDKIGLRAYRDAGINRLSIGAQSFSEKGLAVLGRKHSVDETKHVLTWAHDIFDRLSMDMITARPNLSPLEWAQELHNALEFSGDHMSIYQLTVEDDTPLAKAVAEGRIKMPDEETSAQIYEETRMFMAAAGLPAYEVSNFAKPSSECRHNLAIWRGADYGGIGPAAHGRLTVTDKNEQTGFYATRHVPEALTWVRSPTDTVWEKLSVVERAQEHLMMSLRLYEGASFARFKDLFGPHGYPDMLAFFDPQAMAEMQELEFVTVDAAGVRCTETGSMLLNAVTARLICEPSEKD